MNERDENNYARQRLHAAVQCLVVGGTLKMRLTHAAFQLRIPPKGGVSESVYARVIELRDELTQTPLHVEGHFVPRFHLSNKRAREIAQEILNLYAETHGGV